MSWTPLLTGADRDGALSLAFDTARDMLARTPSDPASAALEAVLLGYLAKALGAATREPMYDRLELAGDLLARQTVHAGLYGGFCGVGWAVSHLQRIGVLAANEADHVNEEIDAHLVAYLRRPPRRIDYDLITGLSGFAVYALEALPGGCSTECLALIVQRLGEQAREHPEGVAWWREPEWLGRAQRERHPRGWFDLGIAHGMPGVVGVLARIGRAQIAVERTSELVAGAIRWMRAHRAVFDGCSVYPATICSDRGPSPTGTAWCYGDPGVALALLTAARCFAEPSWAVEARELARICARRPSRACGIDDIGLCHGAVGLAHVLARLGGALGDGEVVDAARRWWRIGLAMRRRGEGVAGVFTLRGDRETRWESQPDFLNGAVGVALAAIGAATSCEPEWDRLLLADV